MKPPSNSGRPAVQQQQLRPAVANPYLKKRASVPTRPQPMPQTTKAPANAKQRMANPTDGTGNRAPATASVIPAKMAAPLAMTPAAKSAAAKAVATATPKKIIRNDPYQMGTAGKTVTPTPKKQKTNGVAIKSKMSVAGNAHGKAAIRSKSATTPKQHIPKPITGTASTIKQTPTTTNKPTAKKKKGPANLKSQLKSQIAHLHRQKRQFLAQKEAEKQRLLKEKEQQKQRLLKEKEMQRLAKLKEEERQRKMRAMEELQKKKEEERRKKQEEQRRNEVDKCMNVMIRGVETRMALEQTSGVHYAVGEAMEFIIKRIESKEREIKKRERREQAGVLLEGMVDVVERRLMQQPGLDRKNNLMVEGKNDVQNVLQKSMSMHPQHNQQMIMGPSFGMTAQYHQSMQSMYHPMNSMGQPRMQPEPVGYPMHPSMYPAHVNVPGMRHHPMTYLVQAPYPTMSQYGMPQLIQYTNPVNQPMQLASTQYVKPAKPTSVKAISKPSNIVKTNIAKPKALLLHQSPMADPYSPYFKSHRVLPAQITLTKKAVGDSFGVTLRYECKSALAYPPGVINSVVNKPWLKKSTTTPVTSDGALTANTACAATTAITNLPKKPWRKRVDYGVIMVVDAKKATFANDGVALQPGDILLEVNGRSVGGLTFNEACRVIGSTSVTCPTKGVICCALKVARVNVVANSGIVVKQLPLPVRPPVPSAPVMTMIPFHTDGDKIVSGQFSSIEWTSLIRGLSTLPHQLFSGMALIPVSQKEVLDGILKHQEYGKCLQQRSKHALEAKLMYESKRLEFEMEHKAQYYWRSTWGDEVLKDTVNENNALFKMPLTDAQRVALRESARPVKGGCKCGSSSHSFANHPECPLYRDVKLYCVANSINIQMDDKNDKLMKSIAAAKKKNSKEKSAMQKRYNERFLQQIAENAETKKEASFVFEMEKIQSSRMKKAAFAPSSLCTLVLSAVATVMDVVVENKPEVPDNHSKMDGKQDGGMGKVEESEMKVCPAAKELESSDSDSESDDSDDEDMPLSSLISSKRTAATTPKSPPSKRPKQSEASANSRDSKRKVPSPYFMAEILKHISRTHGHLFREPTHSDFAWQQRHRSTLTGPLPKEVMFKGNPREPGLLSFENVRFLLNEERMSRLCNTLQNPKQMQPLQPTSQHVGKDTTDVYNDEWIVTHLSSDHVTGLRHEIDVLTSLGILSIEENGTVVLAQSWEKRVPHMILDEMKEEWGTDMDMHNLFCIHDKIKSSLERHWEYIEDEGWRISSEDADVEGLVFEDEEYQLRKQIFTENYTDWVSEKSGMGEFGV